MFNSFKRVKFPKIKHHTHLLKYLCYCSKIHWKTPFLSLMYFLLRTRMSNYFFLYSFLLYQKIRKGSFMWITLYKFTKPILYIFLGYTSLIWASRKGHLIIVTELLKNAADINAKSTVGKIVYIFNVFCSWFVIWSFKLEISLLLLSIYIILTNMIE